MGLTVAELEQAFHVEKLVNENMRLEIVDARGTQLTLTDRLDVALMPDGQLRNTADAFRFVVEDAELLFSGVNGEWVTFAGDLRETYEIDQRLLLNEDYTHECYLTDVVYDSDLDRTTLYIAPSLGTFVTVLAYSFKTSMLPRTNIADIDKIIYNIAASSTLTIPANADIVIISGSATISEIVITENYHEVVLFFTDVCYVYPQATIIISAPLRTESGSVLGLLCFEGSWFEMFRSVKVENGAAYLLHPTNLVPADAAVDFSPTGVLEASAFTVHGGSDTHESSQFIIYDAAGSVVHDSGEVSGSVEYQIPAGVLASGVVEYSWNVRYRGTSLGLSFYSNLTTFTTAFGFIFLGADHVYKIDSATMTQVLDSFDGHVGLVNTLAFSSEGYLYSGGGDHTIRKIDPDTMTQVGDALTIHTNVVRCLAYGADGFLYSLSEDRNLCKIDTETMTQVGSPFVLASAGRVLAYGADDCIYCYGTFGKVYKIDPTTMTEVGSFTSAYSVYSMACGPDGYLYLGMSSYNVLKINQSNMTLEATALVHTQPVVALVYGADNFIYSSSTTGAIIKIDPITMLQSGETFAGHEVRVGALACATTPFVYSGSIDNTARKIDVETMLQVGEPCTDVPVDILSICADIAIVDLLDF